MRIYTIYIIYSRHLHMAPCRLLIHQDTQRTRTLGVKIAGSVLSAAEGLVVDDVAAGGLAAPSVVVVAVVAEGDLRCGRRAPARLDHDFGVELPVGDGALLLGLVSNGRRKPSLIDRRKRVGLTEQFLSVHGCVQWRSVRSMPSGPRYLRLLLKNARLVSGVFGMVSDRVCRTT